MCFVDSSAIYKVGLRVYIVCPCLVENLIRDTTCLVSLAAIKRKIGNLAIWAFMGEICIMHSFIGYFQWPNIAFRSVLFLTLHDISRIVESTTPRKQFSIVLIICVTPPIAVNYFNGGSDAEDP